MNNKLSFENHTMGNKKQYDIVTLFFTSPTYVISNVVGI